MLHDWYLILWFHLHQNLQYTHRPWNTHKLIKVPFKILLDSFSWHRAVAIKCGGLLSVSMPITQHLGQHPERLLRVPRQHSLCAFSLAASYHCFAIWLSLGQHKQTSLHLHPYMLQLWKAGVHMESGLSLTFPIRPIHVDWQPATFSRNWSWYFHLVCLQVNCIYFRT